jgi:hypothetical protein
VIGGARRNLDERDALSIHNRRRPVVTRFLAVPVDDVVGALRALRSQASGWTERLAGC